MSKYQFRDKLLEFMNGNVKMTMIMECDCIYNSIM